MNTLDYILGGLFAASIVGFVFSAICFLVAGLVDLWKFLRGQ